MKDPSGSAAWSPGTFNGSLAPTVDICELDAAIDTDVAPATPCKSGGYASKYQLTSANVSLVDEHYHLNWGVPSSAAIFFRITVSVGSVALGFVDLKTGTSSELKNMKTGELVPMKDGRTLPIKFRIEQYALCATPGDPTKPCTSKSIDFSQGGTVSNGEPEPSGIVIPAQPGGTVHTVTLADCANLNPRATDLPTFDDCLRVTIDPALTAPLTNAATVFNCAVAVGSVGDVTGTAQAKRLAMLQLNEQVTPPTLKALPHAEPACPTATASVAPNFRTVLAALTHGRVKSAAKQMLAVLAPKPLYAARFIDLGGGGFTHLDGDGGSGGLNSVGVVGGARFSLSAESPATTIRDFQLALPAKFEVSATPTDRSELAGSTITVSVKVTDLGGEPVRNARVRFQPSAGSSVNAAVIESTGSDGLATVQWTLSDAAGENTLVASGKGIAGPDVNGPREGTDPFQPLNTAWGDATDASAPFVVSTGSMKVTATSVASLVTGFESNEAAWTLPPFWHTTTLSGLSNSAYSSLVSLGLNDNSGGAFPSPYVGARALWFGDDTRGHYAGPLASSTQAGGTSTARRFATAVSPEFLVPNSIGAVQLRFWSWFEIESVNPSGFDHMEVRIQEGTAPSALLVRLNPTSDPGGNARIPYTSGGFNRAPEWVQLTKDVSAYKGKRVTLRFSFDTRDVFYNGFRGWIVDDVTLRAASAATASLIPLQPRFDLAPSDSIPARSWQP